METPAPNLTATPIPTDIPPITDVVHEGIAWAGQSTSNFLASLPLIGTRLLFAALAIVLGFLALRIGRKLLGRILRKKDQDTSNTYQQRETLRSLIDSVFRYLVYFIVATVVLSIFGVNVSSIIAVAGVGGVAIGFGAQTLVKDVISGIFLWSEGNITVGDVVSVNTLTGTVESISLRTTTLRDYNGDLYIVPNGDIRTVINESRKFKRALVDVRLNYEDDLDEMLEILRDEMTHAKDSVQGLRETPRILGVTGWQNDCLIVQVSALCDPSAYVAAERELRRRIKNRFDREGIDFPHGPIMARRDAKK